MRKTETRFRSVECAYGAVIRLYPKRFRLRFGPEIMQLFRDCSVAGMQQESAGLLRLWCVMFYDLFLSIPREWHREVIRVDSEIDYPGLADSFMISFVVGTNLLVWGVGGASLALDTARVMSAESMVLVALITVSFAVLVGVLSAAIVARNGHMEFPRIKV